MAGPYRGVVLILIAYALMTGETVLIHYLGDKATPLQFILMRNLGSVVLVAVMARNVGWRVFHTQNTGLQIGRAALTMISLWCLFFGFAELPLADATAVTYTRAIFLMLLAVAFLGDRFSARQWLAVGIGIIGAAIVIKPGFMNWRYEYLVALAGSALNAGSMVATKALERQDSTLTIMSWLTMLSLVACLPALAQPWPGLSEWPWMIGISILGSSGLYVGLMAIRSSELSVLAPFDYTRLIMATAFGLVLFNQVPDLTTLAGAALIVVACAAAATHRGPPPTDNETQVENAPPRTIARLLAWRGRSR